MPPSAVGSLVNGVRGVSDACWPVLSKSVTVYATSIRLRNTGKAARSDQVSTGSGWSRVTPSPPALWFDLHFHQSLINGLPLEEIPIRRVPFVVQSLSPTLFSCHDSSACRLCSSEGTQLSSHLPQILEGNDTMRSLTGRVVFCTFVSVILACGFAVADVFNMGPGATSLELVTVGNAGNAPDMRMQNDGTYGYGSVAYAYRIGKYEVTAAQYMSFLNSVAKMDPYGLYNTAMGEGSGCGIARQGTSGSYTYSVATDRANRPVNYIDWGDAARFANWLTNGQPVGPEGLATTEDGSYRLNGAQSNDELMGVVRKNGAVFVIPSENEWYKAAYHKNDGITDHYWSYPTRSDTTPSNALLSSDPGNNANFYQGGYTDALYRRTEVGAFSNSYGPYGTFDQGGNVFEWNETVVYDVRGERGGAFADFGSDSYHLLLATDRGFNSPWNDSNFHGFRVAEVPEPSLLGAFGIWGIVMLLRSRRREH